MSRYVISIDSSSSACKTSIIDLEGRVVGSSSHPIESFAAEGGILEHDPEEIWRNQLLSMEEALEGIDPDLILGIAITNQRETVVAWDSATKRPICRAISWQDSRNEEFLERYKGKEEFLKGRTGLCLSSYFSVSKMAWILENIDHSPENLRMGTVDTWLMANLTDHGVFATDVTNASRTMLMNLGTGEWDGELLELFGIPRSALPDIFPSGHRYGFWNHGGRRIPILGVIGDQQASLLCGGFRPKTAKATYGTGLFLMMGTGTRLETLEGAITTAAWKIGDGPIHYALECGSYVGGNYVKDLRDGGMFGSYSIENPDFEGVLHARTGGRQIFLFDGRRAPDLLVGISENERGERVLKGALAFVSSIMDEMISVFRRRFPVEEIMVGGNLTSIEYLNVLQSSLSSVDPKKFNYENNSALGAALLVFLFLGLLDEGGLNELISKNLIPCGKNQKFPLISNLIEGAELFKSAL